MTTVEDFTKHRISEEGTYRAFPVAWTIEKADSGAVAIAFKLGIWARWHGKEHGWSEQYATGWFVENRTWVVKKDGTLNEGAIKNLQACGLWDGDWDKLEGAVPSIFVLVDVEKEEYEGREQFRGNWINADAAEPKPRGQFAPVDKGLLQQLRAKHQSKTRAIAGGSAPTGTPPAPPGLPGVAAPASPVQPPAAAAAPTPSLSPPGAPASPTPQPPPWGGGAPTAQTTRPPGAPAPAAPPIPPTVLPDGSKPPF